MKKLTKQDRKDIKNQSARRYIHTRSYGISIQALKEWIKQKYRKRTIYLIFMFLRNGRYDIFTITTKTKYFDRFKKTYYLDPDMMKRELHTGMNMLFYHEDISTPFKIDFNIENLEEIIDDESIKKALNPASLRGFIESQVIEKVLKGSELTKEMQMLRRLVIVGLVLNVVVVLLTAKAQGWI